jgi:hypothetical protein
MFRLTFQKLVLLLVAICQVKPVVENAEDNANQFG